MKYEISIEGITPYMQHRMDDKKLEEWEQNRKLIIERDDVNKEDLTRALFHAYLEDDVKLNKGEDVPAYIPADHIKGALIGAGAMVKSKVGNSRKSMKNIVAAMFFIEQDHIPFTGKFSIDKRSAVNKNVKARIICVRPKWSDWKASFTLNVDNDTITESTIKDILVNAGNYIGIGSYRPTNNGSFGRFKVTKCKKANS